jgi:TrwC relaxase
LTVTGLRDGEYLISSVALNIEEYYAGVGESPGCGRAAGPRVSGWPVWLRPISCGLWVDRKHPTSDVDLVAGSKPRSVLAFDLTFPAPKSVSLLWALGSRPVADVVVAAHRDAVGVALGFLEAQAAVARVQSQGVRAGW